jgi:hypothetical protein
MKSMHIEFLVEEISMEDLLHNLLPKIIGKSISYRIHPFRGKQDLLKSLEKKLKGYKEWIPQDYRIIVLVDRDNDDCIELKLRLEKIALKTSFGTKSNPKDNYYTIINRIVIEELESWFFGDIIALNKAYPKISLFLSNNPKYRDPDEIKGGTWETLEKELQKKGYFKSGLQKRKLSRAVSQYMEPLRNRSKSFQVFRQGLECLINQ